VQLAHATDRDQPSGSRVGVHGGPPRRIVGSLEDSLGSHSGAAISSHRRLTTDQYAPVVLAGGHIVDRPARLPGRQCSVVRLWPDGAEVVTNLERPRDDLLLERRAVDGSF